MCNAFTYIQVKPLSGLIFGSMNRYTRNDIHKKGRSSVKVVKMILVPPVGYTFAVAFKNVRLTDIFPSDFVVNKSCNIGGIGNIDH